MCHNEGSDNVSVGSVLWNILMNNLSNLLQEYKVKVKSLCLTKHHAVKTYWGVEV
jgi:hypothetical protein